MGTATSTLPGRLPGSNPGGNNQTTFAPGVKATPAGAAGNLPFSTMGSGSNPFQAAFTASTTGEGAHGSWSTPSTGTQQTGSLYDTTSHYANGQTDILKQLVDMYGKGVGGSLDNLLKSMSGIDSSIFQQFLASMKPAEASERAGLNQTLGAEGISGNSSVSALANSNLTAQFNAQAAGVNSQLMTQQLQDTMDILMGTKSDAAKEVASSGWGVFADVMNNITGDIGNLMGGSFHSSGSNYGGMGSADNGAAAQLGSGVNLPSAAPGGNASFGADWSGMAPGDNLDTSIFDTSAGDEGIYGETAYSGF